MSLSGLDARMLRATGLGCELTPEQIGERAVCTPDFALSCLHRLRLHYLAEPNRHRSVDRLRTACGENALGGIAPSGSISRHQLHFPWLVCR